VIYVVKDSEEPVRDPGSGVLLVQAGAPWEPCGCRGWEIYTCAARSRAWTNEWHGTAWLLARCRFLGS